MTVPSQYKGFSKLPEHVQQKMDPELAKKYNMGGGVLQRPLFRQMGGPAEAMQPAPMPAPPPPPPPIPPQGDPMVQQTEAQFANIGEQLAQDTMRNIDQAQDIEGAINGLRGNEKPIEARYDELASFVGQSDAQQTPESVLAMVQPTIMMTEQGAMDSGIGELIQSIAGSDMETPTGEPTPMGQGVGELMAMGAGNTPPVNFTQGGPVEVRRFQEGTPPGGNTTAPLGATRFSEIYGDILPTIQQQSAGIFGTPEERARELEEQREFQRSQAMLDLAKFGLALASPTDRPLSPVEKLAAAGQPLATSIQERGKTVQDIKRQQKAEERGLAMQNLQTGLGIAGNIFAKEVEQREAAAERGLRFNLLTTQLASNKEIADAELRLKKDIFDQEKIQFDKNLTLEQNKLASKKEFDNEARELQKFLARFKTAGDLELAKFQGEQQRKFQRIQNLAQERLAKIQGQIFLDNQLEIAGANNSFTLEKMVEELDNAKELAKTNAELNKSAQKNAQIFQASQNALNRVFELRKQGKLLDTQSVENALNRELQQELADDANALSAAQFRMNYLLKERGLTVEEALAESKIINDNLTLQIEAEKNKLNKLGTSLDGLAMNMVSQEDKVKAYADGTLQGTDLNLFEQAITHLGTPVETVDKGVRVIKPSKEFNQNLITAFEERLARGESIPEVAKKAIQAKSLNKNNAQKFTANSAQIALDELLKNVEIAEDVPLSSIFGRNAFFMNLGNIASEIVYPGFTMFEETKVAKDTLEALNFAMVQVFRAMPNFRDSVFAQKSIDKMTAKPANLIQGPDGAISKIKALIGQLKFAEANLAGYVGNPDKFGADFDSVSDINKKRQEIQAVIHRYQLFIGQQPTAFEGNDIGQYLNFDASTEVDDAENKAVVNKILNIFNKKEKKE